MIKIALSATMLGFICIYWGLAALSLMEPKYRLDLGLTTKGNRAGLERERPIKLVFFTLFSLFLFILYIHKGCCVILTVGAEPQIFLRRHCKNKDCSMLHFPYKSVPPFPPSPANLPLSTSWNHTSLPCIPPSAPKHPRRPPPLPPSPPPFVLTTVRVRLNAAIAETTAATSRGAFSRYKHPLPAELRVRE